MKNADSWLDKIGYGISIVGKSVINVANAGGDIINEINEQNRSAINKHKK